ncbi:MAG: polysaccharide pyruvyl transferase family protein [Endomicrobium sp.]|jgi:hypothetical protein|nr:polysaccharide pyruvyl transferase family protein [Endomicrobium sp.]
MGNKFLLFKYNYIKEVSCINIGDYIQTLATRSVLNLLYPSSKFKYFDRDSLELYNRDAVICIMQGWFSHTLSFMPSTKVLPVFVGTHFTHAVQQYLKASNLCSDYFSKVEIGCRDLMTLNFCKQQKISSYFSRCLTLTLPRRNVIKHHKVFLVDVPSEILPFLPNEIRNNAEIIKHCLNKGRFYKIKYKSYLKYAELLLKKYREEGELIITSRLHCALPVIAMGIKIILVVNTNEQKTRFSTVNVILRTYTIDDFKEGRVRYDVPLPNIEELKGYIIENLALSINKQKGDYINEGRIRMIRQNIHRFSS